MIQAAYIHIPFCKHKCDFCDFAAFAGVDHLEDEYAATVVREIGERMATMDGQVSLQSVFYGGGTPGYISASNLARIHQALLERCVLEAECEISLETTPHAITGEKLAQWRKLGINRLSIGVESLDDNELAAMGRDHTHDEAVKGIQLACGSGMPSVCVDLMYGLPTQSVSSLKRTIGEILALSRIYPNLNHVSAYGLHIETNSPLYMRFPKDSPSYPGEEEYRAMFFALVEMLEAEGFFHYEVSNFARTGWQSRHNLNYWSNSEYLAFGVSAHRYISGCRSSNWRSLTRYMRDCLGDETREAIDEKTRLKEAIMLGLRLRNGIEVEQFNARYEVDFLARFGQQIDKLTDCGMLTLDGGRLFISKEHVPISNSIIAEFF